MLLQAWNPGSAPLQTQLKVIFVKSLKPFKPLWGEHPSLRCHGVERALGGPSSPTCAVGIRCAAGSPPRRTSAHGSTAEPGASALHCLASLYPALSPGVLAPAEQ